MSDETPKALECWKTKAERENAGKGERERWMNRPTFILASIGSAVGLGNFWRFPYLTYKYDGAFFFFPYLVCLFFMGIPLLLMELSLGQKIQRGDISVFRSIHPRLAGIGLASVFSAYIITFYYNVIISWSLVYFVAGFINPLPWSENNEAWEWKCNKETTTRAEQFFMIETIRYYDDKCQPYKDGDEGQFSGRALAATFVVWLFCFLAVFKGVHGASYLVWFTVPVPLLFIVIMVINGATLEGAGTGVSKYLQGDYTKFDGLEGDALAKAQADDAAAKAGIWADAAGQIFFSIGVCMGIMTSYGSYNDVRKPIIMDNLIIAISNSTVSFVSGFAVWSVVGYLEAKNSLAKGKVSSIGLAFIAYPTACDMMPASNVWTVILGLTLFLLGIDSAFSMVEATATVICDTPAGKKYPRAFVAFVLCFLGFVLSIPFCTNWGFVLFDVIDHYLCAFLLVLVGILQCAGCGWGFDAERTMALSPEHAKSLKFLTISFWVTLLITGLVFVPLELGLVGMLIWIVLTLIFAAVSWKISGLPAGQWYNEIFMCGVRKIAFAMSCLGRSEPEKQLWWETAFMVYWGTVIKFLIPGALWFILVGAFKGDVINAYGGYAWYWQVAGIIIPLFGLVSFLLGLCVWVKKEDYDERQFDPDFNASQMAADQAVKNDGKEEVVEVTAINKVEPEVDRPPVAG